MSTIKKPADVVLVELIETTVDLLVNKQFILTHPAERTTQQTMLETEMKILRSIFLPKKNRQWVIEALGQIRAKYQTARVASVDRVLSQAF
jgi:hypothetical protein